MTLLTQGLTVAAFSFFAYGAFLLYYVVPMEPNSCDMTYMRPHYVKFKMAAPSHELQYLSHKYSLYRFLQPQHVTLSNAMKVSGVPVLFVPGNKGDYKQVRSLGAVADQISQESKSKRHQLEYFSLDFGEEAGALNGDYLEDQAEFVNAAVSSILRLYRKQARGDKKKLEAAPKSVVVVAHSMGGIAVKYAFTLKSFHHGTMNTVITLSTPHTDAPLYLDKRLRQIYRDADGHWSVGAAKLAYDFVKAASEANKTKEANEVPENPLETPSLTAQTPGEDKPGNTDEDETIVLSEFDDETASSSAQTDKPEEITVAPDTNVTGVSWYGYAKSFFFNDAVRVDDKPKMSAHEMQIRRKAYHMRNVALVSLAGGGKDILVNPSLCRIANFITPDRGLATETKDVPGVGMSIDHQCMCWCNQLCNSVNEALYAIVDDKLGTVYESVEKRMQIFRSHFMSLKDAKAAADAGNAIRAGLNQSVPFAHDKIHSEWSSIGVALRIIGDNSYATVALVVVRNFGPLLLPMCISILLLCFAYQLHMYLPFDGSQFPTIEDAFSPTKHLLWLPIGLMQGGSKKGAFDDDEGAAKAKTFGTWATGLLSVLWLYRSPFSSAVRGMMDGTWVGWAAETMIKTVEWFSPTTLLPVHRSFPPFWVLCILYFSALGFLYFVVRIARIIQTIFARIGLIKVLNKIATFSTERFGSVLQALFWTASLFVVGHVKFEDIGTGKFSASGLNVREAAIGRELAALVITMAFVSSTKGVYYVFTPCSLSGESSISRYRFVIGLLLIFVAPFHVPVFLKCTNSILFDRGYARGVYDLTMSLLVEVGIYCLAAAGDSIPAKCPEQLPSGSKMYYGIEIGPHGPSPEQSEAIRCAVWKDTVLKNIRSRNEAIHKDYSELLKVFETVYEQLKKGPPVKYTKEASKQHIYTHRLLLTLLNVKLMKKQLDLDNVETRGDQDVRAGRRACTWKLDRFMSGAEKLKPVSMVMFNMYEALDECVNKSNGKHIDKIMATHAKEWDAMKAKDVVAPPPLRVDKETSVLENLPIFDDPTSVIRKEPIGMGESVAEEGLETSSSKRAFFWNGDFDFPSQLIIYFACYIGGGYAGVWGLVPMYHTFYFVSALGFMFIFRDYLNNL
jgi:hypothetical protein